MWSCGWPAPAKINLFLHVTGRRDDGYHTLQTLFQFVDHGDALAFRLRSDGLVRRHFALPGVEAHDDLAIRAACRLQARAHIAAGADIAVTKRIPLGGGLGGGSSDAATVLLALNHLWGAGLDAVELQGLALELGADVPVFVGGEAAWAEGVGEALAPAAPREPWYLVVVPPVSVPTAAVFGDAELTRNTPPITIRDFLSGGAGNVCEPVVRRRFPLVGEVLDWLKARGLVARLSGTGAAAFAAFEDEREARWARRELPPGWLGFVAPGRNRSPLATRMEALRAG
jgi:4-diphosphocytidyl-2-C-methyl-D-erythritol kinase